MKIVISGGSGFIGTHLTEALLQKGHKVTILARGAPKQNVDFYDIDLAKQEPPTKALEDAVAVIHLAGKSIFGRWSESLKKEIYNSRVLGAKNLIGTIRKLSKKPPVLISASAVGFYGDRSEEELTESSTAGKDFLAKVCIDWEAAAAEVENLGIRWVSVRTAPVLGDGGLLKLLLPIFRVGLGGSIEDGRQWFPWVHVADIVGVYIFALENENIRGPINAVSPGIVRYKEFVNTLARILKRPTPFQLPKWLLRLVLSDMVDFASASQKVLPTKLIKAGYRFSFPHIEEALRDILAENP